MLEIKNVSKSYADKRVLHHIDLRLSHGIYALLGPNGAGKVKSLLRISIPACSLHLLI